MNDPTKPYRTLFTGTLVQESFLSIGGTDDPFTTVDSPFCRDGQGQPTMRGTGLAGALIATLRRIMGTVPFEISGSDNGAIPSSWRTFNSHPSIDEMAFRQHVAISEETGAPLDGALYNLETLPPGTQWEFLLEVDTARFPEGAKLARLALAEWQAGRCWLGREVARGLGWLRLKDLRCYTLDGRHLDNWPNSRESNHYPAYIAATFKDVWHPVDPTTHWGDGKSPGIIEMSGRLLVGEQAAEDGKGAYGIDSLSIGGHTTDTMNMAWSNEFLAPDAWAKAPISFDPDKGVVLAPGEKDQKEPYIPGSTLRGPWRHALGRLLRARGHDKLLVDRLFGDLKTGSSRLLVSDAFLAEDTKYSLAWLQHHAEDEFLGGAYGPAKFDRVAVMEGCFEWKMVLEAANPEELRVLYEEGIVPLRELAESGQIALGGGQWRGHGWLQWEFVEPKLPWETAK